MTRMTCRTLFDITRTEVKHAFNTGRVPFTDAAGQAITDHRSWMLARNQQRNWETLIQLLSLRTQPQNIAGPDFWIGGEIWWAFDFAVDDAKVFSLGDRPFGQLEQDCAMVPMLIGLREQVTITPMLIPGVNLVFELVHQ